MAGRKGKIHKNDVRMVIIIPNTALIALTNASHCITPPMIDITRQYVNYANKGMVKKFPKPRPKYHFNAIGVGVFSINLSSSIFYTLLCCTQKKNILKLYCSPERQGCSASPSDIKTMVGAMQKHSA